MTPKPVIESPLRRGCSTRQMVQSSREGYRVGLRILLAGALLTCSAIAAGIARGADYPHNDTNDIGCESCHYLRDGNLPPWSGHVPQNIDDTATNNLCWSCHNDLQAPYVRTHSSLSTGNKYGDWSMPCTVCHDQHKQAQCRMYGSSAYLYSGISSAVSATEITQAGAGWVPNQWAGMTVIGDVLSSHYSYRVQSNTADTLVVKGPVDQTVVQVGDNFAIVYGRLVRSTIKSPTSGDRLTKLFANSGDNSFADGDNTYDGVCEVCHTQTNHFRNDGSGPDQHHMNVGGAGGLNCIACHSHKAGFGHGGGGTGSGCGSSTSCHGLQNSHPTHVGGTGSRLSLDCATCHDPNSFPRFNDGKDLPTTTACDPCHSPGGSYDGVNDPVIGAKTNWPAGVYDGSSLTAGKEKWCATCHDEAPSVIQGVTAPNVVGDEDAATPYGTGYGFYKTGHGLPSTQVYPWTAKTGSPLQQLGAGLACDACHDFSAKHIDGLARTYRTPGNSAKYQAGYRLKSVDGNYPLTVPRNYSFGDGVDVHPEDFRLCLSCHDSQAFANVNPNGRFTNFRDDVDIPWHNDHYYHLLQRDTYGFGPMWQSDWKQPPDGRGDSRAQCVQCHNVHGSTRLAMVNDGKLVNREPGIRVLYSTTSSGVPPALTLPDSIYTGWIPDDIGPSKPSSTCTGACHGGPSGAYSFYDRTPFTGIADSDPPTISNLNPANGASGVAGTSNLSFTFSDSGSGNGVDLSTFSIALSGDKGYLRSYSWISISRSGTPNSYNITLDPDADFGGAELMTITVNVSDFAGNALTPPAWSFITASIPVPAAPTMGAATALSTTCIRWNFADNAGDESGFRLHDNSDVTMVDQATTNLSFIDEYFLDPDMLYTRHIHAYNTYGDSGASNSVSRATFSDSPTGAAASKGAYPDKITVSWHSGGSQSGYRVYRDGIAGSGTQAYDAASTSFDDPIADSSNHAYYVYSKNIEGALSSGYTSDTGWTSSGGGPQTITLHPSGISSAGSWSVVGGAWVDILDSHDGDGTYANHGTGAGTDIFYANMDHLASCTSVTDIRISAYIRPTDGSGFGNPYGNANFDIGYRTGAATKWKGSTTISGSAGTYTLIQSLTYTVNSDNGSLTCADINNLKLAVRRLSTGAHQDRVTEVYAVVTYQP